MNCYTTYLRNTIWRLLQDCKNMKHVKQIHSQIITAPQLTDADRHFLVSGLLFFCATSKSGSLTYMDAVFKSVQNLDLFVYNAMIRASVSKTRGPSASKALILYKQLLCDGISPNCLTFPFLLRGCSKSLDFDAGRNIHGHVVKHGFESDIFVQNSLICLYSDFGFLVSARYVFDGMPIRDIVSWNSMIIGSLRCGDLDLALNLFRQMKKRNIITWNSIITGFAQSGQPKEAIEFFHEMQMLGGFMVDPDKITVASVLSACASLGAFDQGKWVHDFLKRSGLECDVVIGTALVDMYGKCGCIGRAVHVFDEMPEKDILAWTAMISAYAINGCGQEAFNIFMEMREHGVRPNSVTFVALLSACAHSGLVEKGKWCFDLMKYVYSMEPQVEHCACMVDILSRAGLFEEAQGLIGNMPMEPDIFVWGALLGGCLIHGNIELGEKVAWHLIDLDPSNHAFYVTLSEIYSKAGRFEDVKRMHVFMSERGVKKNVPGCSMIEVNGVVHEFSMRRFNEIFMGEIMFISDSLGDLMKMENDVFDSLE